MKKIFFLDNQDSFTYNLVEELSALGFDVEVYRNTVSSDHIHQQIKQVQQAGVMPILFLSPGPGKPSDSPCMTELLDLCIGQLPIIGVCLGHQAIAEHYGATVTLAGETIHGKASDINITSHPIFNGFGNRFTVARYHSLVATNIPKQLDIIGQYNDLTMAIIDEDNKVLGFQFHPESILTTDGSRLLKQSIEYLTSADTQ